MSTLDHLTRGRVGWNIVTGYLDSAARNLGLPRQLGHDDRYDLADEYLEVVYKLWEHSWDDDAVRARQGARRLCRSGARAPDRHHGAHYNVPGIHLCEPSPQRTPVLYQAGTSPRGKAFAARHAECDFVSGPSQAVVATLRATQLRAGRARGRAATRRELLIYAQALIITGAHRSRGARQARRLPAPHRYRGVAGVAVGLDRRRLQPLSAGRDHRLHRHRRRPHRAGLVQPGRSRTARGPSRSGPLHRPGRARPGAGRRSRARWPTSSSLDRRDRHRRLQPRLRAWRTRRCAMWSS